MKKYNINNYLLEQLYSKFKGNLNQLTNVFDRKKRTKSYNLPFDKLFKFIPYIQKTSGYCNFYKIHYKLLKTFKTFQIYKNIEIYKFLLFRLKHMDTYEYMIYYF